MPSSRAVWAVTFILSCTACSQGPAAATPPPPSSGAQRVAAEITDADRQEAKEVFAARCTACHGPDGAGDGPASSALTPSPRNFHEPSWQSQVTDDHIEKIIQLGGQAVGKSVAMPPNPDLAKRPGVVKALREHIRALGRP